MANHQNHEKNGVKETQVVSSQPTPITLSSHLSSYNVSVHYVGSITHTHQAKLRVLRGSLPFMTIMGIVIQDVAFIRNVESYTFHSEVAAKLVLKEAKILEDVPSLDGCFMLEFLNFIASQHQFKKLNSRNIYNTWKPMKGCYVDLLDSQEIYGGNNKHQSNLGHKCLEWLDKQAPVSILLVSFGTTTRAELPKGYEKRVVGKRMWLVWKQWDWEWLRDWAPQLEILGHVSTGGFMSHCGCNSCMEGITMGVPTAAWPMHLDQPQNKWEHQEPLVTSSTIEKALRRLMTLKEGNDIKKSIVELGGAIQGSMDDGGASRMELDSFIARITR
ncbi:hypothetical protein PVL29_026435 [Vitis rotundifolia]|uniref:Glycosyltransferase N-terminal domain-containing protein n=1 Tax=Vitis rotundifolia TaxID=103349 RepID=A0AA38YME7_VITRO|nr:hypothetical protein PVL29_026435 [Vitis rotundifolia]